MQQPGWRQTSRQHPQHCGAAGPGEPRVGTAGQQDPQTGLADGPCTVSRDGGFLAQGGKRRVGGTPRVVNEHRARLVQG